MTDHFADLPWFLKEFVYNNKWGSFREIQTRAFDIFKGCDDHILISAGTSSGKTEAAMFPVITSLYTNPPEGIGAMYIGPLKALIDDQFERMEPILKDSYINITGWHGEASRTKKDALLEFPSGILQITPESLQNLIADDPTRIKRLFSELRFIIIDEVHAFMNSERGLQLLCCLQRLEVLAGCDPRRIGLSATIADVDAAADWLTADTGRRTNIVCDPRSGDRVVDIRYHRIPGPENDGTDRKRAITRYYKDLYNLVKDRNCIIFVNSRSDAETAGRSLRKVGEVYGDRDFIHVHHGSISKEYRKIAEEALKDPSKKSAVVATVTLELGIDVGGLDSVVQIEPPYTCSSLVQRMGRSGRRGGSQVMTVMCLEDPERWWTDVEGVNMDLVKAVAMAELSVQEGWTECPRTPQLPYGLLYHQTMEYMKSGAGTRFSMLVSDVLSMHPFRNITKDDYKTLLRHMLSIEHLERMSDGTLLIGSKGERAVFNRDFCSVFTVKKEIEVVCNGKTIGSIQDMPEIGEPIQLAGHVWEVTGIKAKEMTVEVKESDGTACNPWRSGTPPIDTVVVRRMLEILTSDRQYDFLDDAAKERLEDSRGVAKYLRTTSLITETDDGAIRIHPWLGTVQFDTLRRIIRTIDGVSSMSFFSPYYIDVRGNITEDELISGIEEFLENGDRFLLIEQNDKLRFGKFDAYVPDELLMKAFVEDRLDCNFDLDI